jgi:hypothetical protein
MDRTLITDLIDFMYWANHRLLDAASRLSDAAFVAPPAGVAAPRVPRVASPKSVRFSLGDPYADVVTFRTVCGSATTRI